MKKSIFKIRQFWLATILTMLPIVLGLYFYNKLPNEIPIHFDYNFDPDNYGPKNLVIFGFPLFFVIVNTFLWFVVYNDPKGRNINKKLLTVSLWLVPVISCFIQFSIIMYGLGINFNFVTLTPMVIGAVFIFIGNYLPKSRQNYAIGYRTPWALSNKENWIKTNRLGGYLMVFAGILLMFCSLFKNAFSIFIIIIILAAIIPFGYSYYLYKKEA